MFESENPMKSSFMSKYIVSGDLECKKCDGLHEACGMQRCMLCEYVSAPSAVKPNFPFMQVYGYA